MTFTTLLYTGAMLFASFRQAGNRAVLLLREQLSTDKRRYLRRRQSTSLILHFRSFPESARRNLPCVKPVRKFVHRWQAGILNRSLAASGQSRQATKHKTQLSPLSVRQNWQKLSIRSLPGWRKQVSPSFSQAPSNRRAESKVNRLFSFFISLFRINMINSFHCISLDWPSVRQQVSDRYCICSLLPYRLYATFPLPYIAVGCKLIEADQVRTAIPSQYSSRARSLMINSSLISDSLLL